MKETKGIGYAIFRMLFTVSVASLLVKCIDKYIIPYLGTLETIELQEKLGFITLCIEIILVVGAIASIIPVIANVYKKIDTHRCNVHKISKSDSEFNEQINRLIGYNGLNEKISQEEKCIISSYYNENLKQRNKGKLAAVITEHMCVLKYVDNIEPGYEKIESFLKNDLKLSAPGFQQIAESHDNLRNAIKSYQKYLNGEGQEPSDKDSRLYTNYENYVKYDEDKLRYYNEKNCTPDSAKNGELDN
jgi:hypothetical protein